MHALLRVLRNSISRYCLLFLGEARMGALDFYLGLKDKDRWGGAFNGQMNRCAIFDAIVKLQRPELIVETGTYRGTTTEALASIGVPVISFESQHRNYGFARARLRRLPNVSVRLGDSREQLRKLSQQPDTFREKGTLFAYLDAHWNADLPLREELDTVFRWDPDAIVMIDDFHVPGDVGYGYDGYGAGAVLNADYIEPALRAYGLVSLYPRLPSSEESGARRGCVVLASDHRWKSELVSTGLLRQVEPSASARSH